MAAINLPIVSKFYDKGVKDAKGAFGGLNKTLGKVAGLATAAFSITAITNFTKGALAGAEAALVADKRLEQVTKSMNLFGVDTASVTGRLTQFADKTELVTGVQAEVVKQVQATLITFGKLGQSADTAGGSFDRATKAALDLAAAGFGSAETNAIQLGKALQDPIKGLTALSRSGVTFTEQERERIKTLIESNKLGEAQAMILAAIEQQVGGTAEATVTASARMDAAFGQIQDAVGLALLPVLEEFSTWLSTPEGQEKIQEVINGVTEMIDEFSSFVEFLGTSVMPAIEDLTGQEGIQAVVTAIGTLIVSLGLLKIAFAVFSSGHPVLAGIIAGIAAIAAIYSVLGSSIDEVIDKQNEFKSASGAPGGGAVPLGEGSSVSAVGGKVGIIGKVAGTQTKSLPPAIPAKKTTTTTTIPRKIPKLAEGGIVLPEPGGVLANLAEAGRPEAVIPLDRLGNFQGGTNNFSITVNAGMGADGARIGEQIVNEILKFERSSGRVFARA